MSAEGVGLRPIRVLHLRDSPWVDGPGRTILETAARVDPRRVEYHIGVLVADPRQPHPLVESASEQGLNVHSLLDPGGLNRVPVRAVAALLDELEIDVLHTSEFRSSVLGFLARRHRQIRMVRTAHGWIANDLRGKIYVRLDKVLLRGFDRVVLVARAMRRLVPRWWVPDERVRVLHNALMLDSYGLEMLNIPRRVPDPHGEIRLLNVGRLSPEKGQALLLRAVAALRVDYPGIQLAFAGVGPLHDELSKLARLLGLADRVTFLGYVHDMPSLYRDVDVVVQSSLTEGLPNVMLEVAYLGVPAVATDVGGTAEVIEHAVSGWLVRPGSSAALEAGLRAFLEDPAAFLKLARAGRRRVETEFSIATRTELQMRLYEELSENRP